MVILRLFSQPPLSAIVISKNIVILAFTKPESMVRRPDATGDHRVQGVMHKDEARFLVLPVFASLAGPLQKLCGPAS
jgi:hypothetical protein